MNKDVSIVIADDHPMLLKGLHDQLEDSNYNVISSAANGMQALEAILTLQPDIALLDIDMPLLSGFEVVKMAKDKGVHTHFIMLSFHKEADYVTQAKALQIQGYLLKEDPFFEIERCIEAVLSGKYYFSKSFEDNILNNASKEIKKLQLLTPSESTILKLIAQRMATIDIAENLFISARTVEKHRSNIIRKLGLEGETNQLTNWALTNKSTILEL
ncbi:response regulator transcription factor [Dokdonia sp.]|uniref:response regulator transcription factor n=1 Tax=Dokdonia sp. TaxID=2024995 RepID=UPI00326481CD